MNYPKSLNTPRQVYDDQQLLRWKWDQVEPFGVNTPDENPVNLGAFELPFRFPGQYSDRESGLSYNYFRTFDPTLGRYQTFDLVGLAAGMNGFAYVFGDPIRQIDARGLGIIIVGPGGIPVPVPAPPSPSGPSGNKGSPNIPPGLDPDAKPQKITPMVVQPDPIPPQAPKPGQGCRHLFETCLSGVNKYCPVPGIQQVAYAACVTLWLLCESLPDL